MKTRPQKISDFRGRLAEIGRAKDRFSAALIQSNDERHQKSFQPLLDIAEKLLAAETIGATDHLLDDLHALRTSVRRMPLPDIDPILDYETPSLLALRVARSNLVESLDNAIDAASGLLSRSEVADEATIMVDRSDVAKAMSRLDERLNSIELQLSRLEKESILRPDDGALSKDIIARFVQKIGIELGLARFETSLAEVIDFTALATTITNMKGLTDEFVKTVTALVSRFGENVRAAADSLRYSVERGYRGFRTIVKRVRTVFSPDPLRKSPSLSIRPSDELSSIANKSLPEGWSLELIRESLLAGHSVPDVVAASVLQLILNAKKGAGLDAKSVDLNLLSNFANLEVLSLTRTDVQDITPLGILTKLRVLFLSRTMIDDLRPAKTLVHLRQLHIAKTPIRALDGLEHFGLHPVWMTPA